MAAPHYQTAPIMYPQGMQPHFNMRPVVPPTNPPLYPVTTQPNNAGKESTVFVGNISETVPDDMIRSMLNTCGYTVNWKRAQSSAGKLQGFGFCTYQDAQAAIRAIKMLHNLEVGGKKLNVKVDENTKEYLETFKKDKNNQNEEEDKDRFVKQALMAILNNSKLKEPNTEDSDEDKKETPEDVAEELALLTGMKPYQYTTRNQKLDLNELDVDDSKKSLISQEISKFRESYKNDEGPDKEEIDRQIKRRQKLKKSRSSAANGDNSSEANSEDESPDKREKERSKRRSRDRKRSRDRSSRRSSPSSRRRKAPSLSPSPVRDRVRRRDRERSRERERERERRSSVSRSRDTKKRSYSRDRRSPVGVAATIEEEEERREQEKLERQLREKESAYQERLKSWETREKKKIREAEKEREKERDRIKEQIKEAKRLREFLEEYEDQRDDPRFYTSSALSRRLRDREKEKEIDEKDRLKEKEELDEILQRLREEKHPDPEGEVAKIVKEFEENMNKPLKERERELKDRKRKSRTDSSTANRGFSTKLSAASPSKRSSRTADAAKELMRQEAKQVLENSGGVESAAESNDHSVDNDGDTGLPSEETEKQKIAALMSNGGFSYWQNAQEENIKSNISSESKRVQNENPVAAQQHQQQPIFEKKMTIEFGKKTTSNVLQQNTLDRLPVFNGSESGMNQLISNYDSPRGDNSQATPSVPSSPYKSPSSNTTSTVATVTTQHKPMKKKLQQTASVFADDDDEDDEAPKRKKLIPTDAQMPPAPSSIKPQLSAEERQQKVKELISKIPTERDQLFHYNVEWDKVDDMLMEKRIKPWVNKKIKEYIGEEEPTLVDFICSKVQSKGDPAVLLNDVKMVLDEEAEVFVVKLWRLLIYETEAKKQGLSDIK